MRGFIITVVLVLLSACSNAAPTVQVPTTFASASTEASTAVPTPEPPTPSPVSTITPGIPEKLTTVELMTTGGPMKLQMTPDDMCSLVKTVSGIINGRDAYASDIYTTTYDDNMRLQLVRLRAANVVAIKYDFATAQNCS